jgi:hypothetical protein
MPTMSPRVRAGLCVWACLLAGASRASAQSDSQLWGDLSIEWVKPSGVTWGLAVEPKVLLSAPPGEPGWWTVDVTPSLEYAATSWLDVVGELATGYTRQTDDVRSAEVSPRAGVRVHLFSRGLPPLLPGRERSPARRLVVRDLLRVEQRNLFYDGSDEESSSTVRFRNRVEVLLPINRARLTEDGAVYASADWEAFVPLGDPDERFANRHRIRTGAGWRRSAEWRGELLYVWTRSRNSFQDDFETSDHSVVIRLKRVF